MKLATDAIENADLRTHLEARIEETVLAAYRKQGPRAVLATRHCAALHEAGHAIVYHRTADEFLAPPHRLTIKKQQTPLGPTWQGFLHVAPNAPKLSYSTETHPERAWIQAIRTLGGVAAELLHDGHDMRLGSSADEIALAQGIAAGLATPERPAWVVFIEMMNTAIEMLRADEKPLLRIAEKLDRDRKIGTADLRRMLPRGGRSG